jgi:soluble lytic murein transglycosylase-like protein
LARVLRVALRRGTRLSHTLFSLVGVAAVLAAALLWLQPAARTTLAAKLMPFVVAAVRNGPARLLSGQPLPSFAPSGAQQDDDGASPGPFASVDTPAKRVSAEVEPSTSAITNGPNVPSMDGAPFAVASDASDRFRDAAVGLASDASSLIEGLDPRTLPTVDTFAKLIPTERIASDARDDRALISMREQNLVADFIARRYRVARQPVRQLVSAAFETGREVGIDPLLLLAVMAIESGFNPYAESGVGAKGLMQVMSTVHSDKFDYFGGQQAALQPIANIKVGALVLKDCVARGGSVSAGLRLYVGSTSQYDGGYAAKVLAERERLRSVARGGKVPINGPQAPTPLLASASPKRVQLSLSSRSASAAASAKAAAQDTNNPTSAPDSNPADAKHTADAAELGA